MALLPRARPAVDETVLDWRGQWPLILGFVVLIMIAGISVWLTFDARRQNSLVAHTLEVETTANEFYLALQGAETGQRGYLIAQKPEYDGRYLASAKAAPLSYESLLRLTADNPDQQRRLRDLKGPLTAKLNELRQTMDLARAGEVERARDILRTGYGRLLMVSIRSTVDDLLRKENLLLVDRRQSAETSALLLLAVTLAGLGLVVVLAILSFQSVRRYTLAIEAQRDSLKDLNENLEAIVGERTADLTAANEEIQRYAYIVSHDLRAPLVNIMGFTSELEAVRKDVGEFRDAAIAAVPSLEKSSAMAAIDVDLPESIDFIRASTQKMDRLINAILKISREGRRVLTPEPVDMTALIETAAKSVAQQLGDGSVEVANLPSIVSDRLALEQVFGNLIENASKYGRPGIAAEIRVSAINRDTAIEFHVADNGRGIEPRDHERVFDLFRRAGTQDKPGEGIGLAHVRALVRRLSGNIVVQSALGEGATFVVTLPRRLKEEGGSS